MSGPCLCTGFYTQFTLQHGSAFVKDTQCTGAVALECVQTHQLLVGSLGEGIVTQQALGIADGDGNIASAFMQVDEARQRSAYCSSSIWRFSSTHSS